MNLEALVGEDVGEQLSVEGVILDQKDGVLLEDCSPFEDGRR